MNLGRLLIVLNIVFAIAEVCFILVNPVLTIVSAVNVFVACVLIKDGRWSER